VNGARSLAPVPQAGAALKEARPRRAERVARRRAYYDATLEKGARVLLAKGARPNHITFLQLPVLLLELWAAQAGLRWLFVALIGLVVLLDALDGVLARVGRLESRAGAALDALFDTLGIAVVLYGAGMFAPAFATPLMLLFFANLVLFLQNELLGTKVISYLRGPVLVGVLLPQAMPGAVVLAAAILAWLLLWRLPATLRVLFPTLLGSKA